MIVKRKLVAGLLLLTVSLVFLLYLHTRSSPRIHSEREIPPEKHSQSTDSTPGGLNSAKNSLSVARRTLGVNNTLASTAKQLVNQSKLDKDGLLSESASLNNSSYKDRNVDSSSAILPESETRLKANASELPVTLSQSKKDSVQRGNDNASAPHIPQSGSTLHENWSNDTFCYDFLENTLRMPISMCDSVADSMVTDSIRCYGTSHSDHMATCTLENLAVRLPILAKAMYHPDAINFQYDRSLALIKGINTECSKPSVENLKRRVESGDYVYKLVQKVTQTPPVESTVCETWINETVYFYTAHPRHIYFHFLDMYNLHKLLSANHEEPGQFKILRISTSDNYRFKDFDRAAFPEMLHIGDLNDTRTCFRKVVLVPKSYASVLFQCKMHWSLRKDCLNCDGTGLVGTSFASFRRRVLKACSLDEHDNRRNSSLVLISRTPYARDSDDTADKFERILSNEDDLISSLQSTYPTANVSAIHFENLTLCEQIRLANEANVLLGVHGAGLVHLWWLRDDALVFEMEPYFEVGNPSFKVLSKVTGRRYHSDYIGGSWKKVNVEINSVLAALQAHATIPG